MKNELAATTNTELPTIVMLVFKPPQATVDSGLDGRSSNFQLPIHSVEVSVSAANRFVDDPVLTTARHCHV